VTEVRKNIAQSISLYLCRKYADLTLSEIIHVLVNHYGSVSEPIKRFEYELNKDDILAGEVKEVFELINE
ncbi:MAG: hypothetical protein ACC707_18385, partial [Thiohalomonadales bacterium]